MILISIIFKFIKSRIMIFSLFQTLYYNIHIIIKKIHNISFLLKLKHFLNALIICFFSDFNQNAFIFNKLIKVFFYNLFEFFL